MIGNFPAGNRLGFLQRSRGGDFCSKRLTTLATSGGPNQLGPDETLQTPSHCVAEGFKGSEWGGVYGSKSVQKFFSVSRVRPDWKILHWLTERLKSFIITAAPLKSNGTIARDDENNFNVKAKLFNKVL